MKRELIRKEIEQHLVSRGVCAPWNLFSLSLDEVEKLGYKPVQFPAIYADADLICATSSDKDLWIFVDNAADLRKRLREKEIGKSMIVYRYEIRQKQN